MTPTARAQRRDVFQARQLFSIHFITKMFLSADKLIK